MQDATALTKHEAEKLKDGKSDKQLEDHEFIDHRN